ncbi:hypothetical protein ACRAQ7_14270 [Erythrobacter sp. W53]|uniref:hypothetical protein n=1 Tax=Erythrobacter sp. W53 TaxID=3425947 RepID=UPI003D7698E0
MSFHARPIVGPASVDPLANLAIDAPAAELSTRAEPAHIRIDNSRETNLGAAHLAAMVPTASDTDSVSKIAPSVATKAAPTGHTPPHGPSRTGTQQAPSQATQNLPNARAHSAPEQSGKTTHTSQPQSQLQARAQLFANILASAKDYRVATRGIQLSNSEIDRLATDIRAALRGLGLADLPVIVSGTSGEK